jgi:GNAT superfamily N-acetyltransferase
VNPSLTAQLAEDRRARLVRDAAEARLAAPVSTRAPVVAASCLHVRVLEPGDVDAVASLLRRLSAKSRYLRFLSPIQSVSSAAVRHLAAVDHTRHEAIGAFHDGVLVGAAHAYRRADDPAVAEIAFEIADEYQRGGVGTRLLGELAALLRARDVTHLRADLLHENAAALALLRRTGWPMSSSSNGAVRTITLTIQERVPEPDPPCVARAVSTRS